MKAPFFLERTAAVGLLVVAVLLAGILVALPVVGAISERRETLAYNRDMIQRLAPLATGAAPLDAQTDALLQEARSSGRYIIADTEALAAAALQQRVKNLATSLGGELVSVRALPRQADDPPGRIALRLNLRSDYEGFLEFAAEIESGAPYVLIEGMKATSDAWRRQLSGQPGAAQMTFEIDVVAQRGPDA